MIKAKEYYVSDKSEEEALDGELINRYIGTDSKGRYFFEDGIGASTWKYAVEIPKPKIIDWTYKTCPLPPFTVRNKNNNHYVTIDKIRPCETNLNQGVCVSGIWLTFETLRKSATYIPDPTDRAKELTCGSVEG